MKYIREHRILVSTLIADRRRAWAFKEEQRVFRHSPKLSGYKPLTIMILTVALLAVCREIEPLGEAECSGAESLVAAAHAHPTAATYTELGNWYGNEGEFACAEDAFRSALKFDPRSPDALDGLSRSLLGDGDSASVVALLLSARLNEALTVDLGEAQVNQGLIEEATQTLSRGLQKYPASQPLTNALGSLYLLELDADRAAQIAKKSALARPQDLSAQRFYLHVLVANGDVAKGVPLARRLLAIAPHDADLLCLAGSIENVVPDYPAARDHLEKSVAIDPGKAECHYNLGLTLARLAQYEGAKVEFEKALELGTTTPEVHFELAMALRNLGDAETAKAQLKLFQEGRAARDNRRLASVKSTEASRALEAGDAVHAAALYRAAWEAQPKDAMLAYKLSVALDRTGDLAAEEASLQSAVALDPSFALAQEQLGYVEFQLGKMSAAEGSFRQALHAAPDFSQAWSSLAATLATESRFAEAREAVANALRLDPKNADAIQLSRNLANPAAQR